MDLTDIAAPPPPAAETSPAAPSFADIAAGFLEKNPVNDPVFNPSSPATPEGEKETTPPPEGDKKTETPAGETPSTSTAPPVKGRPEAQKRLDQEKLELKNRLQTLENERKALEERLSGHEELTKKHGELELLAQERASKIEEQDKWYKNEESLLRVDPLQLEPVREAALTTRRVLDAFIPDDLSAADESPIPVNQEQFINTRTEHIHTAIKDWKAISGAAHIPSQLRGKYQHVILSTLADALGVDERHFTREEVQNGQGGADTYKIINPSHPVFQRLKANIGELIARTDQFTALKEAAEKSPFETARAMIGKRQADAMAVVRRSGIGLSGDELKAALSKAPENPNLKVMAVLEEYPELLKELNAEIEMEAVVTGHLRRQFDIPASDPAERSKVGQTLTARFEERAREAPLVKPLKKALVAQAEALKKERAEVERLKKELEGYVSQGEAGTSTGNESREAPPKLGAGWNDPLVSRFLAGV